MGSRKIVIIGAAIIDVLVRPAGEKVFQTGSYPAEDIRMSPGGDALNEATILALMGKKVEFQTIIGDDMAGKMIKSHCLDCGIHLPSHAVRQGMATGINVVLVQENGERNFLTNANGSLRKLKLEDVILPFAEETAVLCLASIFVSPELGEKELYQIFSAAKEQGILVCADMTKPKKGERTEDLKKVLPLIDYLLPNEQEVCMLTGKETAEEAAEELFAAGAGNVIVKCGARGCFVRNQEMARLFPAVQQAECVDTTGAGDSFAAGFLYGLSEGYGIAECAEYANQCGAKAISVMGASDWIKG